MAFSVKTVILPDLGFCFYKHNGCAEKMDTAEAINKVYI